MLYIIDISCQKSVFPWGQCPRVPGEKNSLCAIDAQILQTQIGTFGNPVNIRHTQSGWYLTNDSFHPILYNSVKFSSLRKTIFNSEFDLL